MRSYLPLRLRLLGTSDEKRINVCNEYFKENDYSQESLSNVFYYIKKKSKKIEVSKNWVKESKKISEDLSFVFTLLENYDINTEKSEIARSLINDKSLNQEELRKILGLFEDEYTRLELANFWLEKKENPNLDDSIFVLSLSTDNSDKLEEAKTLINEKNLDREELRKILVLFEDNRESLKEILNLFEYNRRLNLANFWLEKKESPNLDDSIFVLSLLEFDHIKLEAAKNLIRTKNPDLEDLKKILNLFEREYYNSEIINFYLKNKENLDFDDSISALSLLESDHIKLEAAKNLIRIKNPDRKSLEKILNLSKNEDYKSKIVNFWLGKKENPNLDDSIFALSFSIGYGKLEEAKALIEKINPDRKSLKKILDLFEDDGKSKIATIWIQKKENVSIENLIEIAHLIPSHNFQESLKIEHPKNSDELLRIFNLSNHLIQNGLDSEQAFALYESNKEGFKVLAKYHKLAIILPVIPANELVNLDESCMRQLNVDNVRESIAHGLVDLKKLLQSQKKEGQFNKKIKELLSAQTEEIISCISELYSTMGVEIECCFRGEIPAIKNNSMKGWSSLPDVSLRPDDKDKSIEYVSDILEKPNDMHQVLALCEAIFDTSYTNKSCGLHVHVGMLDRGSKLNMDNPDLSKLDLIKQILINYAALEGVGLKFPERKYEMIRLAKNKSGERKEISKILDAKSIPELNQLLYEKNDERNGASVNLEALFKHGTIEFRAHSGTVNSRDIVSWMRCINDLIGLSKQMISQKGAHMPEPKDLEKIAEIFSQLRQSDSCVIGSSITNKTLKPSSDVSVENAGSFVVNEQHHN